MGRKLGPKVKASRRYGIALHPKAERILAKRNYPPGVHGPAGRGKTTDYGLQLAEKQKAKLLYGMMERQFANYYTKAVRQSGDSSENLIRLLEMRLDNTVYRLGLATSRDQARQMVTHAHLTVNGKKVNIPSYQVSVGDVIAVRDRSKKSPLFMNSAERLKSATTPSWLSLDDKSLSGKVVDLPKKEDAGPWFDVKTIIEFYSK